MKLPYTTKYNGIYYAANEEIPCDTKVKPELEKKPEVIEEPKVERKTTKKK